MSFTPSKEVLELREGIMRTIESLERQVSNANIPWRREVLMGHLRYHQSFLQLLDACIAGAGGTLYKLWYNDEYSRSMCSFQDFMANYFQNALTLKDE